ASVDLGVTALPAVAARLTDCHAVYAECLQRCLDVVKLEGLDDSRNEPHGDHPLVHCHRLCRTRVSYVQSVCVRTVKPQARLLRQSFPPVTGQPPRMASTKVTGSNGARSSGPSPRPTSFTGTPSSRCTAITMPPLAVPSSLVSTMPVTSTTSANTRAWRRPFCPVVASSTSSTSSTVVFFSTTRLTLPSSSISPTLVCSRPAVSITTTSTPFSVPSLTASNATLAGSAPSRSARTVLAPTRCPHVCNWSAAAARNVSAAPSSTVSPSPISARASFPQVVVLPVPLTPTIRM